MRLFFLTVITYFTSCQTQTDIITTGQRKEIEDSLKSINQIVFTNSEILNLDKALTPFLTTNEFLFISNGQKLSFDQLKKNESAYFSTLKKQRFIFTYQYYDIINDKNAVTTLLGTLEATQKDDSLLKFQIAETLILKKIEPGWKIIGGHESYVSIKPKQN